MADAIISVVVERVVTILEDKIRHEVNLVRGVKDELRYLSKKLKTIQTVLDDAEKRGVDNESVKSWLKKLEAAAYEMDDILDEWDYSLLNHKMKAAPEPEQKIGCSFIRSSCLCFKKVSVRHDIAKKIENVKAVLELIYKERNEFNFVISPPTTDPVPIPSRLQSTHVVDLTKVHGLDIHKKKNDIVSKLMLNGGDTQILSIVGTGGLGKTTLAKLVYNDTQVKSCFERIWICVSDPFDVAGIAIGIVNKVGIEKIPPNSNQLALVLEKLEASISGKKFLLVLDDVWTEEYNEWEPLKISLKCGAADSKILVTTRNERVAKMMGTLDDDMCCPNKLSDEECWSLLRDTSLPGKSEVECRNFEDIGKKIASKCKGLPLAAIVLGRLLQFKDLEGWKHVEKSEIWQLKNVEVELFPHLVLSYNELSPALKRCFSYCAVYPKDHIIHAETLIEEWMAQGYLHSVSGNCAVELEGREYLENLAMRCLFQDIEKSESGEHIEWCKMHDIVHDFALFLRKDDDKERSCQACDPSLASHVQKYRSLSWDKEESCHVCDCMKSVRVLRIKSKRAPPVGTEKLIHLRWLDFSWINLSKDGLEIICKLYFLKSLLLSECDLTEIPREIGNLVHLRRLDLSENQGIKELPESMYSLVELRSLSLRRCSLKEIQKEIGNLVHLRRLDLSCNGEIKELPESICSLVELRYLSLSGCPLKEIQKEIGNLVQLRELDLSYNRELKESPESICSLVELRSLSLRRCSLKEIKKEIGNLVQLRELDLSHNRELVELPESICSLVELRSLSLAHCSLKEIKKEIGNLVQLRELDLSYNRELKELPESICSLVELQILKIQYADINCLPEALGELSNLRRLELRKFKVGSQYNKLGFLKKLHRHFIGYLNLAIYCISMSEMVELVEDARQEQVKTLLQKLETLRISFEGTMNEMELSSLSSSSSTWMEVVEALVPHYKLNNLEIRGYKGSRLPHLMSSPLNFIKQIYLFGLSEVSSFPAMGKLPLLESLEIWSVNQLKLIGREFLGIESSCDDVVVAFPKLNQLCFGNCSKWEEWEDITEEEEESAAISIMPFLTHLSIRWCSSLKKLPHHLLRKASSSLRSLNIEDSSELVKTYGEDKEGSAWRSISQHNPRLELRQGM
ncbi:putative disease resistance protein RGA1 [Salvia divinorum]|uniref:Disease resistance protein RGA1 n=1 Tax=Salvia divinorum TaxID=28513 RepID=A0ABD1G2B0_SALDI